MLNLWNKPLIRQSWVSFFKFLTCMSFFFISFETVKVLIQIILHGTYKLKFKIVCGTTEALLD